MTGSTADRPAVAGSAVRGGLLISFDGPGGVGKTTLSRRLADILAERGLTTQSTTEPSPSPLGQFARHAPDHLSGRALACLIAADRYHHLDAEILPALSAGRIVVTDRYLPASLVLQRLDGVDLDFIWAVNRHVRPPDLAIVCTADPAVLEQRLAARGRHNRFEDPGVSADQSRLYEQTIALLETAGWPVLGLDCTSAAPSELVARILPSVIALVEAQVR